MARLIEWDESGKRLYETGVEKCVLFVQGESGYGNGVAWNGLTKISEKPTGAEVTSLYANDSKYINLTSTEDFEASIEAYTYPDEFAVCDGTAELTAGAMVGQQARKTFGLTYVTKVGNDTDGNDHGYKIHFIYGATASPSEKGYSTINDSPEAITFTWEVKTTPVNVSVSNLKPTASVVVDCTKLSDAKKAALEDYIYGKKGATPTEDVKAQLPLPDKIKEILDGATDANEKPAANAQPQPKAFNKQGK